jgi:hypothetical protein
VKAREVASRPVTDAARRISWRLERLNRRIYVDLNHDPRRAIVVVGSGRSGTTWLAELLTRMLSARLIYEPFHPERIRLLREPTPLFLAPHTRHAALEGYVAALLAGQIRARTLERPRPIRFSRGRVLKDVHAMNTLPWLREHFASLSLVLLLRHPLAVGVSRLRAGEGFRGRPFYGLSGYLSTQGGRREAEESPTADWLPLWDRFHGDPDPLIRYVAEWCIENVYPVTVARRYGITVVFYEDLVLDHRRALSAIASTCPFTSAPPEVVDPARPSTTDWLGHAAAALKEGNREQLVSSWQQEVTGTALARCADIVDKFNLTHVYDCRSPLPLAGLA